jgi:hypothetical protein
MTEFLDKNRAPTMLLKVTMAAETVASVCQMWRNAKDHAVSPTMTDIRDARGNIIGNVLLPIFSSPSKSLKSCEQFM